MNLVPLALSNGTLTFIVFLVIGAFIVFGSVNLRKHLKGVNAPYEADLSEAGREAQRFEHPDL